MWNGRRNPSPTLDSVTSASACTRILLPVIQNPDAPWCAKLQLTEDMIPKLMEQRKEICALLKQRFKDVTLDLVARTPSM